jgi:tripartite-type tricarboxylate transporter receptor subunit TctC
MNQSHSAAHAATAAEPSRNIMFASTMRVIGAILAALAIVLPNAAAAQPGDAYPSRPVTLVVTFAAGGGTDIQARIIARALEPVLGQPVIVENRPGAGGSIGTQAVATAKPDGYTLLVGSTGTHAANQYLYAKLPYDPVKDFAPVTVLATFNNVVVVPASSPIKSLQELIAAAKKNPGKLNYGITTVGSSSHLAVEKFKHDAGLDIVGVPYNGAGLATTDLLGGRLDFMLDLVGTQFENISAGKLRPLATTALARSPVLVGVPTIAESGFPGFSAIGWVGLFAPAATPPAIVNKLAAAVKKAYESPELQASMRSRGFDLATMTPQEYTKFLEEERVKWSAVIRDAQIKLE